MLNNATMRFGTDNFSFSKSALLTAKQPFDTSIYTDVENFIITGTEPASTARRFIFKIDDELFYFVNQTLTAYPHAGELEDILQYGNTAAEINALTNLNALVGKKIYPIIALYAPADLTTMPTAAINLKCRTNTEIYDKSVETAEYDLASVAGSTPRIAEISAKTVCTGNATTEVQCRLKNEDTWSDWISLAAAKDKEAQTVQFKLNYKVTTLDGTDSAKISSILIKHTLGAAQVSGDVAEIYSIVQSYETDLKTCYLVVKHKKLIDSRLEAYVNFMQEPKHRELINIGTSTGTLQTLALAVDGVKDTGIDQNTILLFADGVPITGFSYNVAVSEVTINISAGKAITATYDYGHAVEDWQEMIEEISQQPYKEDGTYMTRFHYTLPDGATDKKISNIRLRLFRPAGKVENSSLGVANGQMQMFVLPHQAKAETIQLNADFSYDADSQILRVVGKKDEELIISFSWLGEAQEILSWTAGWSPT